MNLVLYKHHIFINALCCDSRIKPFLEIDVKGGERDHIKAYHLERSHQRGIVSPPQGEKEISRGENTQEESNPQGSQMLGVHEETCYMSS